MKTYIGVDLGGTNVRTAIVDEQGHILNECKRATDAQKGPEHVVPKIIEMIESLDGYQQCFGIGLGVPGPVDTEKGCMLMSTNLLGFTNYPLAQTMEKHFDIPVFIDNDVNVACLGEATLGSGRHAKSVYYITISTGIGGALVVDQRVIAGKHGYAGEIGNMIIDRNRSKVNDLNIGALENEASGTAITRKGKSLFGEDIRHAGDIFALIDKDDQKALALVDLMAYDIAQAMSSIALIVDPEVFVLGGGVMKSKNYFLPKVIEYYHEMIFAPMKNVQIMEATLAEPGIIGAAMLPMTYIK